MALFGRGLPKLKVSSQLKEMLSAADRVRQDRAASAIDRWNLGSANDFSADLVNGLFSFQFDDHEVVADVQVIGSYSVVSKSWKWGWAQSIVPEEHRQLSAAVPPWAVANGFPQLSEEAVATDEDTGDLLAGLAFSLGNGEVVYRAPNDSAHVYLSLSGLRRSN